LNASFYYWRGGLTMATPRLYSTQILQINLLTIQEVAEWAKVSKKKVYRWISDEKILAIRLGKRTYRIPEKAVIDCLRSIGYESLIK
jgi:excisionase family DNA binding protein